MPIRSPLQRAARVRNRPLLLETLEFRQLLTTLATFDHSPTPYIQTGPNNLQFTSLRAGGATGQYMKFTDAGASGVSALSFDRTDAFAADTIVAEFMFRNTYSVARRDSFDFALLNTSDYGKLATRQRADFGNGFAESLSFRFLVDREVNHDEEMWNDSSLQVIFNGQVAYDLDLTDVLDLHSGQWHRARFIVNAAAGLVSVDITPEGRKPVRVATDLGVIGLEPYEMRAHFANAPGTNAGSVDLDSVAVHFLKANESYLTFDDWRPFAQENGEAISVSLRRIGNLTTEASARVLTTGGTAKADADYELVDDLIRFAPGQETLTVDLAMIDDQTKEENEYFWLRAISANPTMQATDPMASIVRVFDDETGRDQGQVQPLMALGRVPIHTILLPSGKVMFWGRQHDLGPQIYDPATGEVTSVPIADDHHGTGEHFNVFCSGHTLLPDGRVFIAGGHQDDYFGLKTAFIYDPVMNHWTRLPDMAGARWYPTVLPLANGDVLVLHGTIDSPTNFNEQPEVWEAATNTWRKIDVSQDFLDNHQAHQSNFYPRVTLAPDGRVFYFGAGGQTWFLDTRPGVTDPWTAGPQMVSAATPNDYGTITEYAPGKILVVGGGISGTAAAEVIDLNAANPQFRAVSPMFYARRQQNATILPDGRVLITGGQAGQEHVGNVQVQLRPEIWDPITEKFSLQSPLSVERLYHSTGLLMPDGSVWTGGTGEPTVVANARDQRNAQYFQPSYMFYSNRPVITLAPTQAALGQSMYVTINRPLEITSANLIRLGAVTHSLEQSARFVPLQMKQAAGGLYLDVPSNANSLTPGYYYLTVVDYRGVPSISKIIQVLPSSELALVSIDDATALESVGGSLASFQVRLSNAMPTDTTINYRTLASTAKPDLDYLASDESIVIPAGEVSGTITIPIVDDSIRERTEWFAVDLYSASDSVTLGKRRAQAIIADDDGETPPTINIADSSGPEGGYVVLNVSLSSASISSTFVPYVTFEGTAKKQDFSVVASSITVPAGATSGQIRVPVALDAESESQEYFYVRIVDIPGMTLGDGEAKATTVDVPPPTLMPENLSLREGTGANVIASVVVRLSSALNAPVTVNFATQDLTARAGSDYEATSGTLTFQPGETVKSIPILVVGDRSKESAEEFYVNFSSPSRARLSATQVKVKIDNDD